MVNCEADTMLYFSFTKKQNKLLPRNTGKEEVTGEVFAVEHLVVISQLDKNKSS